MADFSRGVRAESGPVFPRILPENRQYKNQDLLNKFTRHELHLSHNTHGLMPSELVVILNPVIYGLIN